MRSDEFFDLLGEIDDKYYTEAKWEEGETVAMEPKIKRRFSAARIAASFVLIIGIAAGAGLLLHNIGLFEAKEERSTETSTLNNITDTDIADITEAPTESTFCDIYVKDLNRVTSHLYELIKPTNVQIDECVSYVLENQNNKESEIAKNVYGPMEVTDLCCYTIDLNFDNIEEMVIVSWDFSDLFIFELKGDEAVYNCTIPKNNIDFIITEKDFTNMGSFYGDDVQSKHEPGDAECYYHFGYEPENGLGELRIIAAGIKYEREKGTYRAAKLMEYCCQKTGKEEFDVWYSVSEEEFPNFGEMDEDKFELLWLRHEKLKCVIFERDIEYCKNYVIDNYDKYLPPDQRGYFTEPDYDNLTFYIKDLDLDGSEEVIVVDWDHSPLFIFTHSPESFVYSSMIGRDKARAYLNEENFLNLAEYDDGEEKFCYYYVETEYAYSDISRMMIAIKPQRDIWVTYSTEYLLSYGMVMGSLNSKDWTAFFRKGIGPDIEELSYEEFNALWSKYKSLPPVSFVDINEKIFSWYENEKHQTVFDFDSHGYDFYAVGSRYYDTYGEENYTEEERYIIDENGGASYTDSTAKQADIDSMFQYAMFGLSNNTLEYMGEVEHYHYGDIVSISGGKAYRFSDPAGPYSYLLIIWNPEADNPKILGTALLKRCRGYEYHYEDYPEFDVNKIPELLPEDGKRRFNEEETALYSAAYPGFAGSVLYSEEKGGYRFELIGENIYKSTGSDEVTIFFEGWNHTRIRKLSDENAATVFYDSGLHDSAEFSEGFEQYAQRVYELKDGIVMFCPSDDTGGTLTPFTTIVENEDGSIEIGYLYGDFGDIMIDMGHIVEGWRQLDIEARFVEDYENNTLYYGDTAFVFDFSKVGVTEYNEEFRSQMPVDCFTAVKAG